MKHLTIKMVTIIFALSCLGLYSCKKEQGPKGDQGEPGINGNANVIQISFGSKTINPGGFTSLTLTGIIKAIAEKSLILSYGKSAGGALWYQLPGYGFAGTREYRTYLDPKDPASILTIEMENGTTAETFEAIRVLVIPANVLVNGRGTSLPYDVSDYESMRAYFNLPR